MRVTVVIPAHNEEALLPRTLAALHAAAGEVLAAHRPPLDSIDVLVVDDASTDATPRIARDSGAGVVSIARRQIAAARNAGARASTGEWLIFLDADTVVPAGVLTAALQALAAGAAGGGAMPRFDGAVPAYARVMLPICTSALRLAGATGGCFLFCTRSAFEAAGGFDEALFASEELGFCRRLRRSGRVVILRERVLTSGRKVRAYTAREILGELLKIGLRPSSTRRRERLGLWYGERRADPRPDAWPRTMGSA